MPSYRIDLVTILRVLSEQSGELHADVKNIPGIKERCHACVTFTKGKVTECVIEHKEKLLYSGDGALRLLQSMGELDWDYTPARIAPPTAPQSPPARVVSQNNERYPARIITEASPSPYRLPQTTIRPTDIPLRIRAVGQTEFASWHRSLRFVYNLIDERKSIEEIARLLSFPYQRTVECIDYLLAGGVITLQRSSLQNHGPPYRLPPASS